jgi:hypothetical protein
MERMTRPLLRAIKIGLLILAVLVGVRCLIDPNYHKYGGFIAGMLLPFGPEFIKLTFKGRVTPRIELIYYLFVFVALHLGINMDFYRTVPYFDKAVHFSSGIFSALAGHYAIQHYKMSSAPAHFKAIFIVGFSLGIAVLWEFFEFACDKFLGQSMQQLVSTGVDDTMYDLIVAFFGCLLGGFMIMNAKFVAYIDWLGPDLKLKPLKKSSKKDD